MSDFVSFSKFKRRVQETCDTKKSLTENTVLEELNIDLDTFTKFLAKSFNVSRSTAKNSIRKDMTMYDIYNQIFV